MANVEFEFSFEAINLWFPSERRTFTAVATDRLSAMRKLERKNPDWDFIY